MHIAARVALAAALLLGSACHRSVRATFVPESIAYTRLVRTTPKAIQVYPADVAALESAGVLVIGSLAVHFHALHRIPNRIARATSSHGATHHLLAEVATSETGSRTKCTTLGSSEKCNTAITTSSIGTYTLFQVPKARWDRLAPVLRPSSM